MIDQRLILPLPTPRRPTRDCVQCGRTTREGKPYCSEHVERCTGAAAAIDGQAQRDAELAAIRDGRPVTTDMAVVGDLVAMLEAFGKRSVRRLAVDLGPEWDSDHVYAVAAHLRREGRAWIVSGRRVRQGLVVEWLD